MPEVTELGSGWRISTEAVHQQTLLSPKVVLLIQVLVEERSGNLPFLIGINDLAVMLPFLKEGELV